MDEQGDLEHLNEDDLLQHCPWCVYRLRGLPVQYRCPECGEELDRRWRVFGGKSIPRKSMRAARPIAFLMIGLGGLSVLWAGLFLLFGQGFGLYILITMSIPVGMGVAAYYIKPRNFIVLAPDGVLMFEGRRQVASYPWEQIGRAHFHTGRVAIALPVGDETVYFHSFKYFRWLVFEADRCVRAINSYPRETAST